MRYYAKINEQNKVEQVIVATLDVVAEYEGDWVETFIDNPTLRYAAIGDGFNGTEFVAPPWRSSIWDATEKRWITPPEIGVLGGDANIQVGGVDTVTVYIAGAEPELELQITINDEALTGVVSDLNGYAETPLASETPGVLVVTWNGLTVEVVAYES